MRTLNPATAFFASAVFALSGLAEAQLLKPTANDLVATTLDQVETKQGLEGLETEPVSYTFALDGKTEIQPQQAPTARSKQFWLVVDAATMAKGLELPLTAPGALVRIQPLGAEKSLRFDEASVSIAHQGRSLTLADATVALADADALRTPELDWGAGTLAFRLDEKLGIDVALSVADLSGDLLVHVFEVSSAIELSLRADRLGYLAGDTVRADAQLDGATLKSVEAELVHPDGRRFPARVDGSRISAKLESLTAAEGLYELEITVIGEVGGRTVRRDVRTAFAATWTTARLDGTLESSGVGSAAIDGLSLSFGVEVASPGRYEVRGVVYGTNADGQLRPMASAHKAEILPSGLSTLSLVVEAQLIADSGMSAPYELRFLELRDQGRMGLLHSQALAARLLPAGGGPLQR